MKILIADDHALLREGLRQVLSDFDESLMVIEAGDFTEALKLVECDCEIGIVLLDLSMPGMAWEDGLKAIRRMLPAEVPVIVLSASDTLDDVRHAMNLGAAGYIPKSASSGVMTSALKLVLSGGVYLPPSLLQANAPGGRSAATHSREGGLTPRQQEVLALLCEGKSNKEIARALDLAEGTIKLHVTAILRALNVTNRTRAVLAARVEAAPH